MILLIIGCAKEPVLEAGEYQFWTTAMEDACLDGALEALFLPEGADTPHAFEFPIYLPSPDELPSSYAIDLREPFIGMPVTVTEGDPGLKVEGSVMEQVLLGESAYGDCTTTMVVDAEIQAVTTSAGAGTAQIAISDFAGTEGRCPVPDSDPCQVTLTLEVEKL